MTDKKLTDKKIVKALEHEIEIAKAVGDNMAYTVEMSVLTNALDLINRLQAENERLRNHIQEGIDLVKQIPEMIATVETESYKEFAKLLIDKSNNGIIKVSDLPDFVAEKEREGK